MDYKDVPGEEWLKTDYARGEQCGYDRGKDDGWGDGWEAGYHHAREEFKQYLLEMLEEMHI